MPRLAIFCGSHAGHNLEHLRLARAVGSRLCASNVGVVYGGGNVGLMSEVADTVLAGGGEVIGVIPRFLEVRELAHRGLTTLHLVETMHERKRLMFELADGFLVLPGGVGTLEEFFEVWSWAQLGLHSKRISLLSRGGYYSGLRQFLEHSCGEGFLREADLGMLCFTENVDDAITWALG